MDASFNIVDLIENNPIARLNNTYQNKLLTKIKANFTDNEQQIFVASFYCFLNYDSTKDLMKQFMHLILVEESEKDTVNITSVA